MDYTLLKDINQESHRWRVRVRVTRFAEYIDDSKPGRILRIDLIFLDEQSNLMDAQIPEHHIPRFAPLLIENSVYYIKYFEVTDTRQSYRPVDWPLMAKFTAHTKIKEVSPIPERFPLYACAPVTFDVLRNRSNDRILLSDTVGVVIAVSHIKTVSVKGVPKPIHNIQITDDSQNAEVTLWGPHSMQFDADAIKTESLRTPVVLLLVGLIVRLHNDQLSLQGSTICKWYANPALPIVASLQTSFSAMPHTNKRTGQLPPQSQNITVTVPEISDLNPHDVLGNSYTVTIGIKSLAPEQPWWYLACSTCKKGVAREGATYRCAKCGVTAADPRYRVTVHGIEPHSIGNPDARTAEFIFFAEIAQELIGCPVTPLVAAADGRLDFIPPQIEKLFGKVCTLRISVPHRALQRMKISYQVDSIVALLPSIPLASAGVQLESNPACFLADSNILTETAHFSGHIMSIPSTVAVHIESIPGPSISDKPVLTQSQLSTASQQETPVCKSLQSPTPSIQGSLEPTSTPQESELTHIAIHEGTPPSPLALAEPDYKLKRKLETTTDNFPLPESTTGGGQEIQGKQPVKRRLFPGSGTD